MRIIGWLLLALLASAPALAAGITVTPEMRQAMARKMTEDCLRNDGELLNKGYTKVQAAAICKCAMQQTAALLNSQTVAYIMANGAMPADMQRKAVSATNGCIKTITNPVTVKEEPGPHPGPPPGKMIPPKPPRP
uniref:Uncharacterized protein n=1 Tax=Desulfovibrio sp. U5L TaxID=596152 RepID=I2Q4A6_9BACT